MIDRLTVLGLITARGGSKGLPGKNLRKVGGVSLIERAVTAGRQADCLDRVVLSSDDPEIIAAAALVGCEVPFIRPPHLATDEARSVDVVRHCLTNLSERYDLVVLLQPTSPLRAPYDIDRAVELCVRAAAPACVSVTEADKAPHWMYGMDAGQALCPVLPVEDRATRRQDLPAVYGINGAVYVARSDWIMAHDSFVGPQTVGYLMPKERSVDIDDELDLLVAEAFERWRKNRDVEADVRSGERRGRLVEPLFNQG